MCKVVRQEKGKRIEGSYMTGRNVFATEKV